MAAVTSAIKHELTDSANERPWMPSPRTPKPRGLSPEPVARILQTRDNLPAQTAVRKLYEKPLAQGVTAVLIFSNFIVSAARAQVSKTMSPSVSEKFDAIEIFFAVIFGLELIWNMYGLWFLEFWKSAWNIFDFVIVTVSVLSIALSNLPGIAVLRLFRAFRVFRLSRRIKSLKQIVEGVISSLPGVANAFVILVMLMGIWSIMGVEFFAEAEEEYFGTFIKAMLTMWQIVTLDSWSDVCRSLVFKHQMPIAALFFVSFIFVAAIVMSNVVVAVLLDKFLGGNSENKEEDQTQNPDDVVNDALEDLFRGRGDVPLENSHQHETEYRETPTSAQLSSSTFNSGMTKVSSSNNLQSASTRSKSADTQRAYLISSIRDLASPSRLNHATTYQLLELATALDSVFQQPAERPAQQQSTQQTQPLPPPLSLTPSQQQQQQQQQPVQQYNTRSRVGQ